MFTHYTKPTPCTLALLVTTTLAATPLVANSNLDAHQHGHATLQVGIDDYTLELSLASPAANLIGFEYAPRNDGEREAISRAIEWLGTTPLIDVAATDCTLTEAVVHQTRESASLHHDEYSNHEDHDHQEKTADSHSTLYVTQQINCMRPISEQTLGTSLFQTYPGIQQLFVEWVSANHQGSTHLNGETQTFQIKP